jgi:hypothetical protein
LKNYQTTYYRRLGWPIDTTACKGCGDANSHKWPGWATKECKPVLVPDQWQDEGYGNYEPIPDNIPDEDLVLMKPWDERSNDEIANDVEIWQETSK